MRLHACSMLAALSLLVSACDPPAPAAHPSTQAAEARARPRREPRLTVASHKADYDRGRAALGAMDALRGREMSEALATDLGYKCADLRAVQRSLASERDPLVWQLVSDIERTCGLDVPLASALFEIDRIEKKRAAAKHELGGEMGSPESGLKGECLGLKLAIGDIGSAYLDNPAVVDAGGKLAQYCGATDSVRAVR